MQVRDTPLRVNERGNTVVLSVGAGGSGVYYGPSESTVTTNTAAPGAQVTITSPMYVKSQGLRDGPPADLDILGGDASPASAGSRSVGERLGTTIGAVGDSITDNGWHATRPTANNGQAYLLWTVLYSKGRLMLKAMPTGRFVAATVGWNSTQITTTHLETLMASPPDVVVIFQGTNDLTDQNGAAALATLMANDRAAIERVLAAGKLPVVVTLPPKNQLGNYGLTATNAWKRRVAKEYGIPCADLFAALAEPNSPGYWSGVTVGGGTSAGTLNLDQTHPNQAGAKIIGQTIWNAIDPYVSQHRVPLPYVNKVATSDTFNAHAVATQNAILLTDTNADGVPDGYTKDPGVTASLATPSQFKGNLETLTWATADGGAASTTALPATAAGRRMLLTVELASTVKAGGGSVECYLRNSNFVTIAAGFTFLTEDIPAGSVLAMEFDWPAGSPTDIPKLNTYVKTAGSVSLGGATIADLTAQGLA